MTETDNNGLLQEIRVVDLSDEKASFCSKILADLGACVIKVEAPGGDPSRRLGPFLNDIPHPEKSLSYWYNNANKLGTKLDLKDKCEREILLDLISKSDVVVESFQPGYLDRLDLGFDHLCRINQGLIMASVTGFGQSGPRKGFKSCDLVASALGGQMYVCGRPSGPPVALPGEQSYLTASLYAAVGVLLAIRKRARTGKGDHIDISLQEAVVSTLDHVMIRFFHDRVVPQRRGSRHWNDFFCILPCKESFIHLTPLLEWETLVDLMDREGKAKDLRDVKWKDEGYRRMNLDHFLGALAEWTKLHTAEELFQMGQLMRMPWAAIYSPQQVLASPQLKARQFFIPVEHTQLSRIVEYPGSPYKFDPGFSSRRRRAPLVDENSVANYLQRGGSSEGDKDAVSLKQVSAGNRMKENILHGVRVLDFTRVLAGPYATRILGDFGAEVIKVQSKRTATGSEDNSGSYFNVWNRNKLSITLDMSHREAREIALKIAAISDVVVENFSPRVMSNWGLNYETLREANEDLIMVSMSGMGQSGPWRNFVAFAPTVQSLGGLSYLIPHNQDTPVDLGYSYADAVSGLYCTIAILAALEYRDRTSMGQYIDLSEYEAVCTLIGPILLDAAVNQKDMPIQGSGANHIPAAPYGCYQCLGEDRWCVIAVFNEAEWQSLCQISGHPGWAQDPRFTSIGMRKAHSKELDILIQEWTSKNTAERMMQVLQEAGIPAGVVQSAKDLAEDLHLQARNFFISLDHPLRTKNVSDGSPIRMGSLLSANWKRAPLLGEDNRYVFLKLLGLTEVEFEKLCARGVIC